MDHMGNQEITPWLLQSRSRPMVDVLYKSTHAHCSKF